ncbi:MAG TPA: 3-oxoadipate enol-lactonase [Candidatus Acidoferrales bacterium]
MPQIKVNGASLRYEWEGPADAPVIMLCNSLGTNLAMWDPQIATLAKEFRVLRYDSRGHGQSEATPGPYTIKGLGQDALGLLDALQIRRVLFCGLSLGGVIAQWLGVNARDRLNAIIISNSAAKIGNDDFWNKRIEKLREGGIAPVAAAQVLRWFTEKYVAANSQVIARMKEMFVATPLDGYIATCAALRDSDLRGSINYIQTPTLVLAGAHDVVTPPADGKFMAVGIPGAQYAELNASHLSNIEDAAEFTAVVVRFFSHQEIR